MAETSTIRTAPETETQPQSLTADEQDSLAVGEALVTEQESLLAGKYKNAEELEKAYVELQKKLGDNSDAGVQEGNEEAAEEEVAAEETTEETEASKDYNEDGSVNYSQVADTYGSEISGVMEKAGLDPWAISKEFHENQGEYTPEMVKQLTDAGFSESAVKSYFAGRAAQEGYTSSESVQDISESQIGEIQTAVGGKETYANMISWASQNLTESAAQAFDATMSTGSLDQIRLAVAGLQAQYENATGYDGEMLTGKAVKSSGDVFRSQAELVQAMSDQRYDNDPAYRQDVIAKLDRSNLDF
jgi:hypothetical protein|tara:strand:+ start:80 stop:985 length:906 start_codon:yes stop_codon:yes gene_type:complete